MACGEDSSIKQVVDDLTEITGFSGKIKWLTDRPEGQDRRMLDMSTTEKMLGFRCQTSLHDGLEKTVNWYRANRKTARNLVATQFN
jgi:GDP-L-fucose synthase